MNEQTVDEPGRESVPPLTTESMPTQIGRYRIERLLGKGGFGLVYLAHDDQLQRLVAIKVPHARLISRPEDAEAYLVEARTVASLDHPNIVPVYDVGSTNDFPCFVVSKFIEGSTLSHKIKDGRPAVKEAVELVATVAETLHYAHRKGLVHRDIKPGNILLDKTGVPFVADFGLALREQDVGKGPRYAGTPAYMSPEQARGEGHRVDGRSDIFSLGVVFYELLVGQQPFRGDSQAELLEQVTNHEPRPLRQMDEGIPKELERICFKALSKRAAERYMTAQDMADDLRHFLAEQKSGHTTIGSSAPTTPALPVPSAATSATPISDGQPLKIVPKGLRSFDAHDADFFLELLPGPRDRDGLPDSIRFWKTRIEEMDADNTFSVGLVYGPSGCGKTSLVKAGLLPLLSDDVIAVYVEATAEETETRLLNGLRKRCPALPDNLGLKETLAALRRGQGIPVGKKMLIVLDQFEQWLHAKKEETDTELVQALRQCDGGRVQCVVMVRDDFWMAVTRFLRELELRLIEGQNSAAVDLFDTDHARKVLAAFGRAFGKLPENPVETSKEQKEFVSQAVSGLSQEGKAICVRLALFAEMMKGKPWTPASLKAVGGTEGVGVTFLEETFCAATAPPEHRYHQKAARADLRALLPETGGDLKGHMRSYAELLEASGYGNRPKDFDDLIRILDNEIRLITPTDPEGKNANNDSVLQTKPGQKYYQLTHDYLVHSIREWLTHKQRETRRGRAELMLADCAVVWNVRPENRQLPSLLQWLNIWCLTHKKYWTQPQQKMMAKAGRYHAVRTAVVAMLLAMVTFVGWEGFGRLKAQTLSDRLLESTTSDVPGIVKEMGPYRRWVDPLVRETYGHAETDKDARKQLHTSLALLPVDAGQVDYLYMRLLKAEPQEFGVIREALFDHKPNVTQRLWTLLENPKNDQEERFRAACALAVFSPEDARWQNAGPDVAALLAMQNPFVIAQWTDAMKGARKWLLPPLAEFMVDEKRSLSDRKMIAIVYGNLADGEPDAYASLETRLNVIIAADAAVEDKSALIRQQASIGSALLVMGRTDKVWPLLKHQSDPTLRSFLMERFGLMSVDAKVLIARLEEEKEASVKRAILLSLGEFGSDRSERLSQAERRNHLPRLLQLYRDAPDPGIHSAVEWLMRQWHMAHQLKDIDKELATGKVENNRKWYVNKQGQTMMIISRPGEFRMGDLLPPVAGIQGSEQQYRRQIDRSFAIGSKEVTLEQFLRFRKAHKAKTLVLFPTMDWPVHEVTWYEAAEYCNWLSDREGIPKDQWCYLPNKEGKYEEGMKMAPNYLQRTGYRLPTEGEWEYACRAGAETLFSFGEEFGYEIVGKYAWHLHNSQAKLHPVGLLKPNDFGLYDMHGNAQEWTQDAYQAIVKSEGGKAIDDTEDMKDIMALNNTTRRVLRGGSFFEIPMTMRSAFRSGSVPTERLATVGFRAARTFEP